MHDPKTFRIEMELVLPRVFELDVKQREKFRHHADDLLLCRVPPGTHAHTSTECANAFTPLFDHLVLACPPLCINLVGFREKVAMVEQRSRHEDHTALPYDIPFQLCVFHYHVLARQPCQCAALPSTRLA